MTGCSGLWLIKIGPVDLAWLCFLSCLRGWSLCWAFCIWRLALRSHFRFLLMCVPRNLKESVIVIGWFDENRCFYWFLCSEVDGHFSSLFFVRDQVIFPAPVDWHLYLQPAGVFIVFWDQSYNCGVIRIFQCPSKSPGFRDTVKCPGVSWTWNRLTEFLYRYCNYYCNNNSAAFCCAMRCGLLLT